MDLLDDYSGSTDYWSTDGHPTIGSGAAAYRRVGECEANGYRRREANGSHNGFPWYEKRVQTSVATPVTDPPGLYVSFSYHFPPGLSTHRCRSAITSGGKSPLVRSKI